MSLTLKFIHGLIFLALLGPFAAFGKGFSCAVFLAVNGGEIGAGEGENDTATVTEKFITYLSVLVDRQVLSLSELEVFKTSLEKNIFAHPFSEASDTRMDRHVHQENLQVYLDQPKGLDKNVILNWIEDFVRTKNRAEVERNKTQESTQNAFVAMKFLPVDLLNYKVEVMQTLVTQKMWMDEMGGQNPSHFKKGGDYPVETISVWSAMEFANRMSIKHGLKPFYDLQRIPLDGKAEDGSLGALVRTNVEAVLSLMDEKNRDIEKENGYRLPTVLEQQALCDVFRNRLSAPLNQEIWLKENSGSETHEVDILPSGRRMKEEELIGLLGNVGAWTATFKKEEMEMTGPGHVEVFIVANAVGGAFDAGESLFNKNPTNGNIFPSEFVGFRLVRTLVKPRDGKP